MITAVDTNILLDILLPDEAFVARSLRAVQEAIDFRGAIISEPVYSEVASRFQAQAEIDSFLDRSELQLVVSTPATLFAAGQAWSVYRRRRPLPLACPRCGTEVSVACANCATPIQPRQHLLADFIIGALALLQADRLLTRDRGYYRTYYPSLVLIDH